MGTTRMRNKRSQSAKRMATNDLFSNTMRYALCAIASGVMIWRVE